MAMVRKLRATVTTITDHGQGVYSLELTAEKPTPRFLPGQFLHLAIDPYDPGGDFWPDSRVFSIASPPDGSRTLRLCYSVVGHFTTRMRDELRPGATVWVKLPFGEFTVGLARETVLLAGGTGFTAFAAFLAQLTAPAHPVHVVYGARSATLLIFRDLVEQTAARCPQLQVDFFVQDGVIPPPSTGRQVCWHAGMIALDGLRPRLTNLGETDFYIAGPPRMIQTLSAALAAGGVPPERIRIDAWA